MRKSANPDVWRHGIIVAAIIIALITLTLAGASEARAAAEDGVCAGGGWISGSSGEQTASGAFGAWRGEPDTIAGTWSDDAGTLTGEYAGWQQNIDLGIWGIHKSQGESWSAAASGAYDDRWASTLDVVKGWLASRPGKTVFIRMAYEFNGSFMSDYNVYRSEIPSYKAAFARFHSLKQQIAPGAKVVWPVNDGTSTDIDVRDAYPGSEVVDVIGVDSYNQYPWVNDAAGFSAKINSTNDDGSPLGVEAWRQYAQSVGKPLAIPEWANCNGSNCAGGGGDAPTWMQLYHDWLVAHAGTGPGQLWYEVNFNVASFGSQFEMYPDDHGAPRTAAMYRSLNWGNGGIFDGSCQ